MKQGALLDWSLHFGGGALFAAAWYGLVYAFVWWTWLMWAAVPLALGLGVVREWAQHRYDRPVWTWHRRSEAAAWGFGALSVCGVVAYALGVIAAVR